MARSGRRAAIPSWGAFPQASFAVGCGPPDEGPWSRGTAHDRVSRRSGGGIRNAVQAWSAPDIDTTIIRDTASRAKYGERLFAVDRVVPDFATWAGRILDDRAGAGLTVGLGEVRPYDETELELMLEERPQRSRHRARV